MAFVDTNVLLDIADGKSEWLAWSSEQLEFALANGGLLINDVVFAEMSVRFHTLEEAVRFAETLGLVQLAISRDALFNAGKAFQAYRWAGGGKENVLPDFFVGAHALELAVPLLTRDPKVYRTYFPTLELITP